jgi:hypothetical protein
MEERLTVTVASKGNIDSIEGEAFIGSTVGSDGSQSFGGGFFSLSRLLEIASQNTFGVLKVGIDMEVEPEVLMQLLVDSTLRAFSTAVKHMTENYTEKETEYHKDFAFATMNLAKRLYGYGNRDVE